MDRSYELYLDNRKEFKNNDFLINQDRVDILDRIRPSAVLILQSAGEVVHEGVEVEQDEAGAYLSGSAHNAAIVQNWAVKDAGLPQENIHFHNFSVATSSHPRQVIQKFLNRYTVDNEYDDNFWRYPKRPLIYYTGHGDCNGSWHFTLYGRQNEAVVITPDDLKKFCVQALPYHMQYFRVSPSTPLTPFDSRICERTRCYVISQSCYSGNWLEGSPADDLWQGWITFRGITSAGPNQTSRSSPVGSEFTRWLFLDDRVPIHSTPTIRLYGLMPGLTNTCVIV